LRPNAKRQVEALPQVPKKKRIKNSQDAWEAAQLALTQAHAYEAAASAANLRYQKALQTFGVLYALECASEGEHK
jgi:hypothetical protein